MFRQFWYDRLLILLLIGTSTAVSAVEVLAVSGAGGLPLHVIEAGERSKPGILFLHGATMSSSSWLQQFESPLADDYHLVAFDLRGHGNSAKPWNPFGYSDSRLWADDVAAVIEATGLKRPVVVAWSYGGHVTMDFLRHYPSDRFAGIVFVGSSGGMLPFNPPDAATAAEFARLGKLSMSPDAGDRLEAARGFVDGMLQAPVPQNIRDREVAAVLAVTPGTRQVMQSRALDNSDLVDRLTMPVLFVMGDAERAHSPQDIESLLQNIPDARQSIFPGTGHMPFIERQERFDAELAAFVVEVTSDR